VVARVPEGSTPERIGSGESEQLGTRVEEARPTRSDGLHRPVLDENARKAPSDASGS
jgi:hypothetical protein